MRLFWEKGFLGVSLPDLEKRTGLSRSSLYNSFGSKQEVFEQALARYREAMGEQMCRPLETGERGLADLAAFFDGVAGMFASQRGATGCLMVNSMVEFGGADQGVARHQTEHLTRVRGAITAALQRAVALGEIPADTVESKGNVALSLLLGITVAARAGLPRREISTMVGAAQTQIREWSSSRPARV
jgi:TetR/AcrR family transcriptional repressor of nem operon